MGPRYDRPRWVGPCWPHRLRVVGTTLAVAVSRTSRRSTSSCRRTSGRPGTSQVWLLAENPRRSDVTCRATSGRRAVPRLAHASGHSLTSYRRTGRLRGHESQLRVRKDTGGRDSSIPAAPSERPGTKVRGGADENVQVTTRAWSVAWTHQTGLEGSDDATECESPHGSAADTRVESGCGWPSVPLPCHQ